jgi:uncharacterized membrane protein YhaH (DUF805 family)
VKDGILKAVERAACVVAVLAFFLPFLTVRSCSTQEMTDYRGYELLGQGGGWIFVIPMGLAAVFFAMTFLRPREPSLRGLFGETWKVLLAATAGFVVWAGSMLVFMFDKVIPRAGFWLCGACWVLLFVTHAARGLRLHGDLRRSGGLAAAEAGGPYGVAVVFHYAAAVVLAALPAAAFAVDRAHDPDPLVWYAVVIPALPMLAVAALGLRRAERWAARWSTAFSLLVAAVLVLAAFDFFRLGRGGILIVIVPCVFFCLAAFFTTAAALRPGRAAGSDREDAGR